MDRSIAIRLRALNVGRDAPLHVVLAHARTRSRPSVVAVGSGRTRAEAARRARSEATERLSGFFVGDETRVTASHRDLAPDALHPNDWLLHHTPRPFDPDARLEWSPLWSVSAQRKRFLPTQLLYYDYPRRRAYGGRADSNGAAAGRTLADAALRGLLEVVERDSVALWWYNRARRPSVAIDNASDPYVRKLCAWFRAPGRDRDCWALDLTSDLGIPVVAAVSRRRVAGEPEAIVFGFGAHLSRERATRRALLEMGQMLALVAEARRGTLALPSAARRWLRDASLASERHLQPITGSTVPVTHATSGTTGTASNAFQECCTVLERHGLEVLLADQSRPRYGMHAVKVVVPGLRPWWPRFAPGRLYDAPVKAGWRASPIRTSALNPRPIWF